MIQAPLRTSPFSERLLGAARANRSWLCVGLDPEPSDDVVPFVTGIVEATRDLVCCYKPNLAFFEATRAARNQSLRALLAGHSDDMPVLIDAKRGDTPQHDAGVRASHLRRARRRRRDREPVPGR